MSLFSYILGIIPLIQNLPISTSTRLVYTSIGMVFKIYPFPNKWYIRIVSLARYHVMPIIFVILYINSYVFCIVSKYDFTDMLHFQV